MARYIVGWEHTDIRAARETAENVSHGGRAPVVLRLRDKPAGPPLVSRMLAAARHDGITHAHMVQRSGAWLLASNVRHVVGVECSDVGPSGADAKIAALLRDQVPDFKPTHTASRKDLLSHTPLVSVAGVVVPTESLRVCLAVLPDGVDRVGVRRVPGDGYVLETMKRVHMARLALCAPGWRAMIAPMHIAEKCPTVQLRKYKKGEV